MASLAPHRTMAKPSFASVAARAPPTPKLKAPVSNDSVSKVAPAAKGSVTKDAAPTKAVTLANTTPLETSMTRMNITPVINTSAKISQTESDKSPNALDEKSQISSSTKTTSLNDKSVTSATTFAIDEKESLRPDDSASMKAGEEEDFQSGQASGAPSSRVGSEAGGKAFRDQFNEISERIIPGGTRVLQTRRNLPVSVEEVGEGHNAPTIARLSGAVPQDVLVLGGLTHRAKLQVPDEKLIEALDSPKDRLYLLQIEQQVIAFIQDAQKAILDLPPCNSFCRLLAHRLGDYYALEHIVDNAITAVRFYKTPSSSIPAPLSSFSKPSIVSSGPVSTLPSMKIMRRGGTGEQGRIHGSGDNTTTSSMAPSKAGSDLEDESHRGTGVASPTESMILKDKSAMTREEREAKYKETRDRIFKNFEDTENSEVLASGETSNQISRTSSATGRKKTRKNRQNDDGFDTRSQFNVYYPSGAYGATYAQAPVQIPFPQLYAAQQYGIPQAEPQPIYNPSFTPPSGISMYQPPPSQPMAISNQSYQMPAGQTVIPYGPPNYPQPQNMVPSSQMMMSSPTPSDASSISRPQFSRSQSQMSDPSWPQGNYTNAYPMPQTPSQTFQQPISRSPGGGVHMMNYPYGQLPYQMNGQSGRPAHPLPGSFNRHALNPQIQAFVPGAGFLPSQPSNYGHRPAPVPNYPPNMMGNGNTSATIYASPQMYLGPPQAPQPANYSPWIQPAANTNELPVPSQSQAPLRNRHTSRNKSSSAGNSHSQLPTPPLLAKWSSAANLPPKPPPPESSTTSGTMAPSFPLRQGVPTFQNGTYSKPT
ncbi:hypothetical protein MMC25_006939 [Agyrium rufum]|nr:hypothetical protein [Agyrium rufum]